MLVPNCNIVERARIAERMVEHFWDCNWWIVVRTAAGRMLAPAMVGAVAQAKLKAFSWVVTPVVSSWRGEVVWAKAFFKNG